jgi:predicted dehydrogenase
MPQPHSTRRDFLKTTSVAAVTTASFIPAAALGKDGSKKAPSERITLGAIGVGGKGTNNMTTFASFDDVQVVAVCDVDAGHQGAAQKIINEKYGNQDCAGIKDFRELIARDDIDAVSIATPDHWHSIPSIAAANAKKDIYCEKPLTNSIGEGRAVVNAAKANNVVFQVGSHERSTEGCRIACELVQNGRIGKLHTLAIQMPHDQNHHKKLIAEAHIMPPPMEVPKELDWNFWLGHTEEAPYTEKRGHFWWRFHLTYGGGEMTDRGAHVIDIGQLGAEKDNTGPVEVDARGTHNPNGLFNCFTDYVFVNTYADGLRIVGQNKGPRGVRFEGSEGSIFVHIHGGKLEASDPSLLKVGSGAGWKSIGRSPEGHRRNFIDCIKSRKTPMAPVEAGHRTATICHLNNIGMLLNRRLEWDPVKEQFVDDDEANALVMPKMRAPWTI